MSAAKGRRIGNTVSPFSEEAQFKTASFAVAPDSVAAVGPDKMIQLIDLSTGKERWRRKSADDHVEALTFSPDGKILASSEGWAPKR